MGLIKISWMIIATFFFTSAAFGGPLKVGFGMRDITPVDFEERPVNSKEPNFKRGDKFYDTGWDRLFDFEELGALGLDGKPGIAGVDDDGDGIVDNCDRKRCREYLAKGSDDLPDPNNDNFRNPLNVTGTERDGKFQFVHIAGFGPYFSDLFGARMAAGVHDPIWSRAIAIQGSNGVPVILVSADLPGLAWKHINPVRRKIQKYFGIPASNIVIASTHNHAGPDGSGYWSTMLPDHGRNYAYQLRGWIYESIAEAIRNMEPAEMKAVTTTHYSCLNPKTYELKREPYCNLARIRKDVKDQKEHDDAVMQADLRDPVDRNTRIVAAQFLSQKDRSTIATFINWHTHPDTLKSANVYISSDFPHFLRQYVEKYLGGKAVYFSGTVGNQIGITTADVPLWTEDFERVIDPDHTGPNGERIPVLIGKSGWELTRSIGYEAGWEVVRALQDESSALANIDVTVKTEPLDTQVDNFLHVVATGPIWSEDVEKPDRMRRYLGGCANLRGCVRSDVSVITIGELGMLTAPGEVDPAYLYGRTAVTGHFKWPFGKHRFPAMPALDPYVPGKHHAFLGQANNYLSYLVHTHDNHGWWNFEHPNWYEEFVTIGKDFGDDAGNKLMQMLGSKERYSKRVIHPSASEVTAAGVKTQANLPWKWNPADVLKRMVRPKGR